MKKLDKLILGSFIGPFFLTFIVVDFILLTVNMLKYFDEIFGKGLSFWIYMELISYFVISISPMALPLAVLLSALMTFGNLGEHFELTAIKSSGISLLRALRPIGIFVVFLTIGAFLSNNYLVPKVNLKTFSLLYDIRMKSPALDIKEGVFYAGIPNYSIKVNKKLDDIRLQDIIIYNHAEGQGNTNVILADSGRMEPFFNDSYLSLTLYNGVNYKESRDQRAKTEKPANFSRTYFSENQIIFNLESFQMNRTPEDLWSTNRSIKNISGLKEGLDSIYSEMNQIVFYNFANTESNYTFFTRNRKLTPPADVAERKRVDDSLRLERGKIKQARQDSSRNIIDASSYNATSDSLNIELFAYNSQEEEMEDKPSIDSVISQSVGGAEMVDSENTQGKDRKGLSIDGFDFTPLSRSDSIRLFKKNRSEDTVRVTRLTTEQLLRMDSIIEVNNYEQRAATVAINNARTLKNNFSNKVSQLDNLEREYRRYQIAWYQKYTTAFACIVMFLIGAPLGAIIKKGGLGMPVLMSIIFFIVYYMLTITGEKWAKEGITDAVLGTWFSNLVLLPFGFFFLKQARKDARIFEADVYLELWNKIRAFFKRKFSKT
ncbi:LptF/LptG family permease [Mongoliitalea daihaiensis]|uniref:LptF/LptG family permease n=1 Tax=Mongoliitalea daihaiensis TaxID=2782006 RepID=UPI001F2E571E|nr:LptF/LptG family permease [Mongoliitalea daihaiensis]UJP64082.1 LptF/LptG family permease [Mongoliitalea daihaiensis]